MIDISLYGVKYEQIAKTLLEVFDHPENRCYLRDITDLTKILSLLTSVDAKPKDPNPKQIQRSENVLKRLKNVIVTLIRNSNGLFVGLILLSDSTGI